MSKTKTANIDIVFDDSDRPNGHTIIFRNKDNVQSTITAGFFTPSFFAAIECAQKASQVRASESATLAI